MLEVALSLIEKMDVRNEITDEFGEENKFIVLCKKRIPQHVKINRKFGHIIADVIFQKFGDNTFEMGEATEKKSAADVLKEEPIRLTKEKVENKIASLLKKDYEIITNPCMETCEAIFYVNKGALKLVE